ncbi:MAG: HAD family hydrolase [Actinomycetota bacterium]|nr:HAD family hydrolase [Actinomycetota bacterium]
MTTAPLPTSPTAGQPTPDSDRRGDPGPSFPPGRRPGVLFDFDGTLVDTNYLHTLAWSQALATAGEWAPMNAIHRLVGMGGEQLLEELLGHSNEVARSARPEFYKRLTDQVRPFPGAGELLRALHDREVAVVVATSAPEAELTPLLDLLASADAIDAITTADDVGEAKPSPEVFLKALEAGSVDPARALVVGDSVWDVRAAQAAGLGCVGVETGGFSRHELSEAGAVAVYRDVQEMGRQLSTGPLAHLVVAAGWQPH